MTTELTASQGIVQGSSREKLVNDFKRAVVDVDGLLNNVVGSSADQLAATRLRFKIRLGEARRSLDYARIVANIKACSAVGATQDYVRGNPVKIIGVFTMASLIAALFIGRRSFK